MLDLSEAPAQSWRTINVLVFAGAITTDNFVVVVNAIDCSVRMEVLSLRGIVSDISSTTIENISREDLFPL